MQVQSDWQHNRRLPQVQGGDDAQTLTGPWRDAMPNTASKLLIRLLLWTVVCTISAFPSFAIAAAQGYDPTGMVSGVIIFILAYTAVTGAHVFQRLKSHPVVQTTLHIGYGTRLVVSVLVPFGCICDFWTGNLSIEIVSLFLSQPKTFLGTLMITILQGIFLNIILATYMGVVCLLLYVLPEVWPQPRWERQRHSPGMRRADMSRRPSWRTRILNRWKNWWKPTPGMPPTAGRGGLFFGLCMVSIAGSYAIFGGGPFLRLVYWVYCLPCFAIGCWFIDVGAKEVHRYKRYRRHEQGLCPGCGYNLYGLPEKRCPECGREFAPGDPGSFAPLEESSRDSLFWAIPLLVAAYPLLLLVLSLGTWAAAVISLGRASQAGVDNVLLINETVSLLHSLTELAWGGLTVYLLFLPLLVIGYALLGRCKRDVDRALRLLVLSLALLVCLWLGALVSLWLGSHSGTLTRAYGGIRTFDFF